MVAVVTTTAIAAVGGCASAGAAGLASAAPHSRALPRTGILPPRNPAKNISPNPNFYEYCVAGGLDNTAACNAKALQAIDRARGTEPIGPLRFNLSKFLKLSEARQLFVIADLERVSRGEPPITALTIQLDKSAQAGANIDDDPHLAARTLSGGAEVRAWGSNWAGGSESVLGSDDGWMYDDGFGSHNGGCTSPKATECWGHRDNILRPWSSDLTGCTAADSQLVMGAAYARSSKWDTSFAEIFVAACGHEPTGEIYTWAEAQAALGISSPRPAGTAASAGRERIFVVGSTEVSPGDRSSAVTDRIRQR